MFHFIYFLINTLAWGIIFTMLTGFSIGLLSVAAHCLANGLGKSTAIAEISSTVSDSEETESSQSVQQRKSAASDPSMAIEISQGPAKRQTSRAKKAEGFGRPSSLADMLRQEAGLRAV
jgi:predicted ABC-type ATPase